MFCHTKLKRFLSATGAPLPAAEIQWRDAFCSNAYRCDDHWKSKCTLEHWKSLTIRTRTGSRWQCTRVPERLPWYKWYFIALFAQIENKIIWPTTSNLCARAFPKHETLGELFHFPFTTATPSSLTTLFFVSFLFFSPVVVVAFRCGRQLQWLIRRLFAFLLYSVHWKHSFSHMSTKIMHGTVSLRASPEFDAIQSFSMQCRDQRRRRRWKWRQRPLRSVCSHWIVSFWLPVVVSIQRVPSKCITGWLMLCHMDMNERHADAN